MNEDKHGPRTAAEAMALHLELVGHDMERWIGLFAEDAVVEFPYAGSVGRSGRLAGKAAIDGYFRGTPGTFRELRFSDLRLHACVDPELAIAEVHGSAIVGPMGRRYEQDYVMVLRTRGGAIVSYREYWDPTPVLAAFEGAVPGVEV